MIEDEIECETINTSIVTFSKPSDFFRADCSYVVTSNFFFSSELVKFFIMVQQVTPSVSSFSECLELFFDFGHISVSPSDVIPIATSYVRPPRKCIYLFVLSLGVLPNEFLVLHLPEIHDKIHR